MTSLLNLEKRRARQNSIGKPLAGRNDEFEDRMRRLRDLIQKEQSLTQANQEINARLSTLKDIGKENKRVAEAVVKEPQKADRKSLNARLPQNSIRALQLPLIRKNSAAIAGK